MVVVQVEKYCVRGQTSGKTVEPATAADHVHFVPDVLHVKVDGFFRDLAVTVVGTSADCFLQQKESSLMTVTVMTASCT